jgi:hypothetical protein
MIPKLPCWSAEPTSSHRRQLWSPAVTAVWCVASSACISAVVRTGSEGTFSSFTVARKSIPAARYTPVKETLLWLPHATAVAGHCLPVITSTSTRQPR